MWLACRHCQARRLFSIEQRIDALRKLGKLGARSKADPEIVEALFSAALPDIPCPECGKPGLQPGEPTTAQRGSQINVSDEDAWAVAIEEDPEAWGESRRCKHCQRMIEPERLDVLPDTDRCASCASSGASQPEDESEYCVRCGGTLQLTQRRGSGLAGYVMRCTDCGASSR